MNRIKRVIKRIKKEPAWIWLFLGYIGMLKWMPDALYLRITYRLCMHKKLNLKSPQSYNEKLQWLKLHDHNPLYQKLVDKYEVKQIVENKIGAKYIIPTLGVWESVNDIDFDSLPKQFVIKSTHDSGSVFVCKDKDKLDINLVKRKMAKSLKRNYFWSAREWPYKNISHRIIAEKFVEDMKTKSLDDYKFFCFNGKVDNCMVVRGRAEGRTQYYHFDRNWNLCRFNRLTRSLPEGYSEQKPEFIDEMIEIAEKLSEGMIHVRIDLYEANGQIYFGEYTFYSQSGFESGFDDYSDGYLGSLIKLPIEK